MNRLMFENVAAQFVSCLFLLLIAVSSNGCKDNPTATPQVGSISGRVLVDTGGVCTQALVYSNPPSSSLLTDSLGRFTLTDLNAGSYTVYAVKTGYDTGSVSVNVIAGKVTQADMIVKVSFINHSPGPLNNLLPDSAKIVPLDTVIDLTWICTDPDGDALVYDVYVDTVDNPSTMKLVSASQSATTYSQVVSNIPTRYYWRVVARDPLGKTSNGPLWTFKALQDYALHFDGLTQYARADASDELTLSDKDFTIELWVYIEKVNNTWQVILAKDNTNSETDYLIQADKNGHFLFQCRNLDNMLYSKTSFNAKTWYHIAAQQSIAKNQLRLYINGVLETESTILGNSVTTANPLIIGTRINSASGNAPASSFTGAIDNLRIIRAYRTSAQIAQDMKSIPNGSEPQAIGAWSFDEGTGLTAKDLTPSAINFTLKNGTTWMHR